MQRNVCHGAAPDLRLEVVKTTGKGSPPRPWPLWPLERDSNQEKPGGRHGVHVLHTQA